MESELERVERAEAPDGVDDPDTVDGDESADPGLSDAQAEALAGALLWRIGHAYEDGPVTIRVGFASAAPLFAELPRLRAASDQEVEAALASGDVRVEWVGPRGGARS